MDIALSLINFVVGSLGFFITTAVSTVFQALIEPLLSALAGGIIAQSQTGGM